MRAFLSRLFRPAPPPVAVTPPPDERHIFRLTVAGVVRHYDPFAVERELLRVGGDEWTNLPYKLNKLRLTPPGMEPKQAALRRAERDEALGKVVAMGRAAFALPPLALDGGGVTDNEACGAVFEYMLFVGGLRQQALPFPS